MAKDSDPAEPAANLSNPRETQAMLAYIVTGGFLGICAYAVARAASFADIGTVLSAVSPLATMVLAFFFANKASRQAQPAAEATT